jgi:4-amino-4-deoxy-L-arabinose transferase-like glycosyltransferase
LWTRRRFGVQAALYAAFILAVNPVSILTANRLWTEDLMTLLLTAAMFLYYRGHGRRQVVLCFVAGILMGLAALTNQKALLAAAGAGVYTFFAVRADRRRTLSFLTDLCWWVFVFGHIPGDVLVVLDGLESLWEPDLGTKVSDDTGI